MSDKHSPIGLLEYILMEKNSEDLTGTYIFAGKPTSEDLQLLKNAHGNKLEVGVLINTTGNLTAISIVPVSDLSPQGLLSYSNIVDKIGDVGIDITAHIDIYPDFSLLIRRRPNPNCTNLLLTDLGLTEYRPSERIAKPLLAYYDNLTRTKNLDIGWTDTDEMESNEMTKAEADRLREFAFYSHLKRNTAPEDLIVFITSWLTETEEGKKYFVQVPWSDEENINRLLRGESLLPDLEA